MTARPMNRLFKTLLFGALLAGIVWAFRGPPGAADARTAFAIGEAEVAHLQARWYRQWNRPPTREELKRSVDAYIRNEILYREALATGLDRGDQTVRLAMVRKMEMLAAGRADARDVTDEDLAAFFSLRKEQYRIPARMSVLQVYFKDGTNGVPARERAQAVLEQFREAEPDGAALAAAGDAIMLDALHANVTAPDLERQLGAEFAAEVLPLPDNTWSGPVRSGFGLHLVKVFDRIPGRVPDLEAVRERVVLDLRYEAQKAAKDQGYQEIAGKYQVTMSDAAEAILTGNRP
jgi:hypothetical protein